MQRTVGTGSSGGGRAAADEQGGVVLAKSLRKLSTQQLGGYEAAVLADKVASADSPIRQEVTNAIAKGAGVFARAVLYKLEFGDSKEYWEAWEPVEKASNGGTAPVARAPVPQVRERCWVHPKRW